MKKLSLIQSRKTSLTVFKCLVRTNVDYADTIYGKPFNEGFKGKLEMVHILLHL